MRDADPEARLVAAPGLPLVLLVGAALGLAMGAIIHYFEIQPFIVTLAGLFLARGLCYAITTDSITIDEPTFVGLGPQATLRFGDYFLTAGAIIAIIVVLIGVTSCTTRGSAATSTRSAAASSPRC